MCGIGLMHDKSRKPLLLAQQPRSVILDVEHGNSTYKLLATYVYDSNIAPKFFIAPHLHL